MTGGFTFSSWVRVNDRIYSFYKSLAPNSPPQEPCLTYWRLPFGFRFTVKEVKK
jgi:hypothetical protein